MQYDPTRYRLHDGIIEAIEYDAQLQQLILHIEYNLNLAVNYDPASPDDDFRQTRLLLAGVEVIPSELARIIQAIADNADCYGDILECNWNNNYTSTTLEILLNFFDPAKQTEEFIQTQICYQTVEWQIDPPFEQA
ncbi:hypothetical protein [Herpetosiphon geysericola]|uniref:Uncharacterized protein n=1 Tax=Herpetosiphon geysericola TaxID=70996 RepID=A0A0P6YM25_9CHLR|nr:hypothetical protein [Herpetosiphon geysericola]KPL91676.1 hypothetical protein SE18_01420 [Herpetosiphon geysericola]